MKKFIYIIALALPLWGVGSSAFAQKNYNIDEIREGWAKKPIIGVADGNILTLLAAFNKTWRTAPATELLAHPVTNENHEDAYAIVVDRSNGYVSAQELGDDGEDISACVWKRTNGHKLFAVVFTRSYGLYPQRIALFYDYDSAKKKLTPEPNELSRFTPSYDKDSGVDVINIQLPQQGKDVVVTEYLMGWYLSIKHTYTWDGMRPKRASTTIENYDKMEQMYNSRYQFENRIKFTQYALVDIDEDRNPELWLFSANNDYQAIYSIVEGNVQMLSSTYYKTQFSFFNQGAPCAILSAGSCGTGCFRADYTVVEKSLPKFRLADQQDYNYQKDDMESTYYKDDKKISNAEGERIQKSFGDPVDIEPVRRPL